MKKIGLFMMSLVLFFSCSEQENWIVYRGELGQGRTSKVLTPPLALKWKLQLQSSPSEDRHFNSPVIEKGIIYFGGPDGNFYALDIQTGYMKWIYKTNGPINSIPLVMEDRVVFGSSDGNIYALTKNTGELLWSFWAGAPVNSTLAPWEDKIFTAGDGGEVLLLSKEGRLLKFMENPMWSKMTFVMDGNVVHHIPGPASRDYSLGAYDLSQERFLWFLPRGQGIWVSSPAIDENNTYYTVANFSQGTFGRGPGVEIRYVARDKRQGKIVWEEVIYDTYDVPDSLSRTLMMEYLAVLDYLAPAIYGKHVIYTNGTPKVRAFHADNGAVLWERTLSAPTTSSPIVAGNKVYFGVRGTEGRPSLLVCLSAVDGSVQWEREIEGDLMSAPVIAGKWMVFGTTANLFYVLEEIFG